MSKIKQVLENTVIIEDLLENHHTRFLEYFEPWPGLSVDSNDVDCHVTVKMSVHDAINYRRKQYVDMGKGYILVSMTDADILEDFIINHWAAIVEE